MSISKVDSDKPSQFKVFFYKIGCSGLFAGFVFVGLGLFNITIPPKPQPFWPYIFFTIIGTAAFAAYGLFGVRTRDPFNTPLMYQSVTMRGIFKVFTVPMFIFSYSYLLWISWKWLLICVVPLTIVLALSGILNILGEIYLLPIHFFGSWLYAKAKKSERS